MLTARRTATFTESVIREMTRIANQHGAMNLAQGFPDFPMPEPMKEAACAAIHGDVNQYAITWGTPALRLGIAEKYRRWYGMEVDPERDVTVTCGATEAMAAVFLALLNPDDEVIVFEPFYENYGPDAILADARPVFVPLERPDWRIDPEKLRAAFSSRTKAIIVNTPHNPTGRVFTREEITMIADLCKEHDVWAITDEIYEHIRYAGGHHPIATWPDMRERTVTISGLSKVGRDSKGPRFPDRRCAGSPPGSGRHRHVVRRGLLQPSRRRLPRATRRARHGADRCGLLLLCPRGRILHPRRLFRAQRPR
jgi:aspartate/methionine/tyrosine aminotransferase